jgi:hypothetical protein
VEQHPADGGEGDDDGDRDRPHADADLAGGLLGAFVLGDLAVPLFGYAARA